MMVIYGVSVVWLLFKGGELIPHRWQLIMELIHSNVRSVVYEGLRKAGEKYFPFVLCLFLFIVILNVLGVWPYVFTPTAHLVVTFGFSLSIMMGVTLLGVLTFKIEFVSILVPRGVPLILAPILGVIETLSYMIRALSLGLRLGANVSAGHLLFAILSGFAFNLFFNGYLFLGCFLIFIMASIALLEMMVAVIQAYVFSLLTTIYLGDTIALH